MASTDAAWCVVCVLCLGPVLVPIEATEVQVGLSESVYIVGAVQGQGLRSPEPASILTLEENYRFSSELGSPTFPIGTVVSTYSYFSFAQFQLPTAST